MAIELCAEWAWKNMVWGHCVMWAGGVVEWSWRTMYVGSGLEWAERLCMDNYVCSGAGRPWWEEYV